MSICDILEDKMMREAQIEVRMNIETVLSRIMRCLISRTTLSLMIDERYAIISVILFEDIRQFFALSVV